MGITNSKVAKRYAKALFSVVEPENFDRVKTILKVLADAWEESADLREVLQNPAVNSANKSELLNALIDLRKDVPPQVKNFLAELLVQARIAALPEIVTIFSELVDNFRKSLSLEVTTVAEVSDSEKTEFSNLLKSKLGDKVSLSWHQDPSVIGGVVIKCGDKLLDKSVAGMLNQMRAALLQ